MMLEGKYKGAVDNNIDLQVSLVKLMFMQMQLAQSSGSLMPDII